MTKVVCHADAENLPSVRKAADVHVVLYGRGTMPLGVARIGSMLMDPISRLKLGIRADAFDFLTIALAVTAADTFVLRSKAEDRWCRRLELTVPLVDPRPWNAVRQMLEQALRFLSGDQWILRFKRGGPRPPGKSVRDRRRIFIDLSRAECACLFSGGLDSYVGVLDLLAAGRRPILVSHAYRGDRKYQKDVAAALPAACPRFAANAHPTWIGPTDVSMRTRSFNFLAYGALAATAIAQFRGWPRVDLIVPENGHIALNPPLTPRRIGSHSTRTTHPFFLTAIQRIMDEVGLPVAINNPLRHQTKGEMMSRQAKATSSFATTAIDTVSCGKWKRKNKQCGHCVPCLIRRAAFHAAAISDDTPYREDDLLRVVTDPRARDDVISVLTAVSRSRTKKLEHWVLQAGPLPQELSERSACVDVFRRGIKELGDFLRASGFP
jgi:Queuosine biosynthesis protein QueC